MPKRPALLFFSIIVLTGITCSACQYFQIKTIKSGGVVTGFSVVRKDSRPAPAQSANEDHVALSARGVQLYEAGRYEEALPIAKRVVELRARTVKEKPANYAASLNNLAVLYDTMGEYGKAEPLYKEAMAIHKEVLGEKHPAYAASLNNLAVLYDTMDEYGKAEPLYREAMGIRKKALGVKHPNYAASLNNLATLYTHIGEFGKAEPLYKEALAIRKEAQGETHPDYAGSLNNLATLYYAMGEYGKAEPLYKEALAITKKALGEKHPDYAGSLNNLAGLYRAMGEYGKAEPLYKEALAIKKEVLGERHPDYAPSLNGLGVVYGCWNKPQPALELQLASLGSVESFMTEMALWASEKRQQTYSEKVELCYDQFYSLLARYFRNQGDAAKQALAAHLAYKGRGIAALTTRNRLALTARDPAQARIIEQLRSVVLQIANLSLAGPGKSDSAAYKQRIAALEQQKEDLEAALARGSAEYAEKRAARKATPDAVAAALPRGALYLDFADYWKYDYDAAKGTPDRRYLAFSLARGEDGKGIARIEDLGPAEEIDSLVSRFRAVLQGGDDPGRRIGVASAAPAARLKKQVPEEIRTVGTQLYEKLLRPFEKEMQSASALILSPSGNLNLIPFELLSIPNQEGYLLDRFDVAYCLGRDAVGEVFRLRNIGVAPAQPAAPGSLPRIIAAPDFDRTAEDGARLTASAAPLPAQPLSAANRDVRLPTRSIVKEWPLRVQPLPGTLTEGNLILGKIANARRGTLSSGAEASELNVKRLSRPAFLHVATHGFFLEDVEQAAPEERMRAIGVSALGGGESPLGPEPTLKGPLQVHNPLLRSGLALAGFNRLADGAEIASSENDGILTAMEVTGLDLTGTQLVVLSACETGLGETKRGEGVAGLRQAFRIAGARNVVMSLWNVPDQETVWLMDAFYSSYLAGKTPTAALKEARSAVRKRLVERDGLDHPRYWGAFILEGPPPPKNP